jgi:hypothetical protein
MGKVVRFSEFDNYFNDLVSKGIKAEGTILDANIIITLGHEPKKFHTRLDDFIKSKITARGIKLFTTVNTTQEFLEFYRRILLTEGLRTAIAPETKIKLPNNKRSVIRLHYRVAGQTSTVVTRNREGLLTGNLFDIIWQKNTRKII